MFKKAITLVIFLCLFLSTNAPAINYQYAGIHSEHREYSAAFGGANWYMMQAAAVLSDYNYDPSNPVKLKIDDGSSVDIYELRYYGDQFLGNHLFVYAFPPFPTPPPPAGWGGPYPHPSEPIWSSASYEFSVNDGNGDPVTANWTIPYTQQLAIPYISSVDPTNHVFDWDDVSGADTYQLQIAPLDDSGNPALHLAFYSSGDLSVSEFTVGDLSPGDYAIWIQARDEHPDYPGKFLNRSSYIFDYHVPGAPGRDQGQIFGTDGDLELETDEWSQSITTGISGRLTKIVIQFHYGVPEQPPALNLSIFDGGNPISGSALFSEQLFITSTDLYGENLFAWDLSSAGLIFNAGDVFSFVLQADGMGYNIAGNDPPGYERGELFKNGIPNTELSDIAFITYVEPNQPPIAIANGPYTGNVSSSIIFDGSGSYDPDGVIVLYEWDFENDGVYDVSSTSPMATYAYSLPFSGLVSLRVTDEYGLSSTDIASVQIINQPPIALCRDATQPTSTGVCSAYTSVDDGSYDPDGDPVSLEQSPPGPYDLGTTEVTLTVTDDKGDSDTCTATATVVDQEPPILTCPAPQVEECTGSEGAAVSFNTTSTDNCTGDPSVVCDPASGSIFPLGSTSVSCTGTDESGNASSCDLTVTVEDTIPPEISLTVSPDTLWPPNHKMRSVTVTTSATDICDPAPICQIISVNSNESENSLGDGDTAPDWEITGELTVNLRSERSGTGIGREYTITVKCTDNSGNINTADTIVFVPHGKD